MGQISVTLHLSCGGCNKTEDIKGMLKQQGQDFSLETDSFDNSWLLFDPITKVTYCMECWNMICQGEE